MNGKSRPKAAPESPTKATTTRVAEQADLFEIRQDIYGDVTIHDAPPLSSASPSNRTVRLVEQGHRRMANTVGADLWLRGAGEQIRRWVDVGETFDADRLQDAQGAPPNAGLTAVAIRRAKLAGLCKVVGFTSSTRPEARGHGQRVWGPR